MEESSSTEFTNYANYVKAWLLANNAARTNTCVAKSQTLEVCGALYAPSVIKCPDSQRTCAITSSFTYICMC